MNNLSENVLVIAERTPQYIGGSGDQKVLYTSYFQISNVSFCILNDNKRTEYALGNCAYYFSIKENDGDKKKWRYEDFIKYFSTKQDRFLRSEKYLCHIIDKIQEIIDEKNIQILVFEQTGILMWTWHRPFSDKMKCILRVHDSHFLNLLSDIRTRSKISSKIALLGSAMVQAKYEKKHIKEWDQIQYLSLKEYNYYCKKFANISQNFIHTPSSIMVEQINEYLLYRKKETDILFVGTMSWKPNTDAVKWFILEILPIIKNEFPDIRVRIIGKNATKKIGFAEKNIDVIGFLQSLDDEFRSAKLFINPSISGGGIKVKLMHAAGFGLPVISTSNGVSGFKENIRDCILVKDKPVDFATAILQLIRSEELRKEYSQKIFEYAQNEFNLHNNQEVWKAALRKLL